MYSGWGCASPYFGIGVCGVCLSAAVGAQSFQPQPPIQHVFIIVMENMDWSEVKGSWEAPFINNTLLPAASHAEQYYGVPLLHPSEPNYLWLEAGSNFGITNDNPPATNMQSTENHLTSLIDQAGLSWKAYVESIPGGACPLTDDPPYAVAVNPTMFFADVTGSGDPQNAYCIAHEVPFANLATDLAANQVANLNWLIPNLCDDAHSCPLSTGDSWLQQTVTMIESSPAYTSGGAIFITWDETDDETGAVTPAVPIGLIVASPAAKGHGYFNNINYTHASTLRTICEIFGLTPPLGAATATDLSDLFQTADTPVVALNMAPAALAFGSAAVGAAMAAQQITLTADGTGTVSLNSIAASGPFALTNDCPLTLSAGASCNLELSFNPVAVGAAGGQLTIASTAAGSPATVNLSGTGLAAEAALSPGSIAFGARAVGTASAPAAVEIANAGNVALHFTTAVSAGFAEADDCAGAVAAGGACTATVTFTPKTSGPQSGTLTVSDNAAGSPQTIALSGEGTAATAALSPTTVSFGGVPVGAAPVTKSVVLANTGNAALQISGVGFSGGAFTLTNGCGNTLAAGAQCTLTIVYAPTAAGAQSGTLTVNDDAPGSPQTVAVQAVGLAAGISLSATAMTFASQEVGTQSAAQTVNITNSGNATLTLGAVSATGDFQSSSDCGASLAPAALCHLAVVFAPTAAGTRTGTLQISSGAGAAAVSLSGSASDFSLSTDSNVISLSGDQAANFSVTLSPIDGFSDAAVALACVSPQGGDCTIGPSALPIGASPAQAQGVFLPPTTTAGLPPVLAFLGLFAGWIALARAEGRRRLARMEARLLLAGLLLLTACGGPSPPAPAATTTPADAAGSYPLQITAQSSSGVSHQISVTVQVQ